jgi:hypothetical protein
MGQDEKRSRGGVIEPPNYDGPHVPFIVIMTSDSRTYVPHNLMWQNLLNNMAHIYLLSS